MTTRRLSRADVDREHTYEWLMEREDAETLRCPTCLVAPGVTCRNIHTGRPLTWQPAHGPRLAAYAASSPSAPPATVTPAVPRPRDPSSPTSPPAAASSASRAVAA